MRPFPARAKGSDEFQLGQTLGQFIIVARRAARMNPGHSSLSCQLIQRDPFSLNESYITQIHQRDVRALTGILAREGADDGVAYVRRKRMRFDRVADDMLNHLPIAEPNNQLKKRIM